MIDPVIRHPELFRREEDVLPRRWQLPRGCGARAHWRKAGEAARFGITALDRLMR
ncbi:hypothetical protein E0K89_012090 [Aquicoccus sp. SCR17]|nr:hypothetical protein [Carideicomes alvinocaridis]